jgi:hypothetical protein
MGDRVLIQVVGPKIPGERKREVSPVAYGHWCGSRVPDILERLRARMLTRGADVPYTFARLIQEMIAGDDGNLSFGAWNQSQPLTEKDSPGDAGCVLIHVGPEGMRFECFGGYLSTSADGRQVRDPTAAAA